MSNSYDKYRDTLKSLKETKNFNDKAHKVILDCSIIHTNLRIEIEQFKHENSEDQSIVDSILDSITDLSAKIPHEKTEAITKLVKSIRSRNVFIDKNNKLITQIDNECGKIVKKLQDNKPKIATMYNTITRYNKKSKTYTPGLQSITEGTEDGKKIRSRSRKLRK